jgi:hypothetical protein
LRTLIFSIVLFFLPASNATAAVKWLSRANCLGLINESVTYDRPEFQSYVMMTSSSHIGYGAVGGHVALAPMESTWRSYAGDVGDATVNAVNGGHQHVTDDGQLIVAYTSATDCNLSEW